MKPNTKKNGVLKPGLPATIYYHKEGSVAAQVDLVEALKGLLVPGNEPDPPLPSGCPGVPPNDLKVFLGDSLAYTSKDELTLLRIKGIDALGLRRTPNGVATFAKVFSEDGKMVVQIVDNHFYFNPGNSFRVDTPDSHTLAVYDSLQMQILYIRYMNPYSIRVKGIFPTPRGTPVVITDNELQLGNSLFSGSCFGEVVVAVDVP